MNSLFPKFKIKNGLGIIHLKSWKEIDELFKSGLFYGQTHIYRGQADYEWKLIPSIYRIEPKPSQEEVKEYLTFFKKSSLGRRGQNSRSYNNDDKWWALGRHFGLKTPILDWTASPYIALFFAFAESNDSERRTIYALDKVIISTAAALHGRELDTSNIWVNEDFIDPNDEQWKSILNSANKFKSLPIEEKINIIEPNLEESYRMISQKGLFTRGPERISIEDWVNDSFIGFNEIPVLYKIMLPNMNRNACLMYLNMMNINYLSLFPDLYGAAMHCNLSLEIPDYF